MLADYINKKPVIKTKRLILRRMNADDAEALKEWMPDSSIYEYWGKAMGKTDKNPELMFIKPEKPSKSFHLGIALAETDKVIGELWVYLITNDRMATVAIRLSKKEHNKGYGTEALNAITDFCFKNTELKRLFAEIDVRNEASWKLFEKCGYTREGMIRQGKMVNSWCDYYIYGKLSED